MVGGGSLLKCERWERDGVFRQCFRCSKYDHRPHQCKEEVVCGQCSGPHDTRDHPEGNTTKKCPLCSGPHAAWEIACPHRKKELEKGKLRLKKKAAYFDTADLRTTARREEADRVEEFTLVTSKQTKKRKITEEGEQAPRPKLGRPRKIDQAEKGQPTIFTGFRKTSPQSSQAAAPIQVVVVEDTQMEMESNSPNVTS